MAHTIYKNKDGKRVKSVTTILGLLAKPALIKWANNLGLQGIDCSDYTDKAAKIGTLIHAMCEQHIKEKMHTDYEDINYAEYTEEQIDLAQNGFLKFLEWESKHTIEYLMSETGWVSETYQYGGTFDCYAIVDGKKTLIDFKTGKGIYKEYFCQTSAYKNLLNENGYDVEQITIINIGRNEEELTKTETIEIEEANKYFEIFKSLIDITNAMKIIGWSLYGG